MGKSIFDLIHPDDQPRAHALFAELMRRPGHKVRLECRARRKEGDWGNLEAVGVNRLDDPSVEAIIVTTRDISERKRARRVQQATYRIADAASVERSLEDLLRAIPHDIRRRADARPDNPSTSPSWRLGPDLSGSRSRISSTGSTRNSSPSRWGGT